MPSAPSTSCARKPATATERSVGTSQTIEMGNAKLRAWTAVQSVSIAEMVKSVKKTTSTGIDADPNLSMRGSWTAGGSMNSGGSAPRAMMDSGLMSSSIVSVIRSFEKEERLDLAMSGLM